MLRLNHHELHDGAALVRRQSPFRNGSQNRVDRAADIPRMLNVGQLELDRRRPAARKQPVHTQLHRRAVAPLRHRDALAEMSSSSARSMRSRDIVDLSPEPFGRPFGLPLMPGKNPF